MVGVEVVMEVVMAAVGDTARWLFVRLILWRRRVYCKAEYLVEKKSGCALG